MLSSDDPVRVFQDFAEVDLLSGGRAEIRAGRGSFIESFPLFGYDLDDYDDLYAEKLELLLAVRDARRTSRGRGAIARRWRTPVCGRGRCRTRCPCGWRLAGRRSRSCAPPRSGCRSIIAIIGGQPERFVPLVELYREVWAQARHDRAAARVAINTHAFVGTTSQEADRAFAAPYLQMMNRIGRERGWPPSGRAQYEALRSPRGALAVGDPEQVAEKLLFEHELFGHQRYVAQMSLGAVEHRDVLRSMELFGTEVAPVVRAEVARRAAAQQAA